MKKIFILTNDMNGGGAEKVLLTLLRHMPRKNYHITLGLVYRRGPNLDCIPSDIPVRYLFEDEAEGSSKRIRNSAGELYKIIAPKDSDIEIAFLEGNATKIMSASSNDGAKKVAWVHIDLNLFHYTAFLYDNDKEELRAYQAFDRIVFVSLGALAGFETRFGTAIHERSVVQYNPVDVEEITEKAKAFLVPTQHLTLCASGRLVQQKGFQRLLDVVSRLQSDGFIFDLWFLGDGPDRDLLTEMAQKLPKPDSVSFLGYQNNPYPFMQAADIFVCSSFVEGLSLVIGEALILGRQVISTDCCGTREALQNGRFGLLTGNDTESLYQGLRAMLCGNTRIKGLTSKTRYAPYDMHLNLPSTLDLLESL